MQKAVIAADVVAFLEADKALDEAMALAADNPFAARLAAPLQTHSRRFWFRYQARNRAGRSRRAPCRADPGHPRRRRGGCRRARPDRLMALLRVHAETAALR